MNEIQTSLKCILCELLKDVEVQENIRKIVRSNHNSTEEFQWRMKELEREKEILYHQDRKSVV